MTGRVAVLGAGLLGAALAAEYARAGRSVTFTTGATGAQAALDRVRSHLSDAPVDIAWAPDAENAARGASVIVECLPERLDLKHAELTAAAAAADEHVIVCTNTSSFTVADVARGTSRPDRVIGTHYLNPPNKFDVVELIVGPDTAPDVVVAAEAELQSLGTRPIRVGDTPGFVINRLQFALLREACALVDAGIVTPEDLDELVMRGLARRWSAAGPFTIVALGGATLFDELAKRLYPVLAAAGRPARSLGRLDFGASIDRVRTEVAIRLAGPGQ
jgi:3-hydroxybutyryl-CoA dehydrogenase